MRRVATVRDLAPLVGQELGTSEWLPVEQARIDEFARASGDHQWIHVDVERARREMPGGATIAHGYLTLALMTSLLGTLYAVERKARSINYGANRIRFTQPVPAGARIRLRARLDSLELVEGGGRITLDCRMEIEGEERPALIAEQIVLILDPA